MQTSLTIKPKFKKLKEEDIKALAIEDQIKYYNDLRDSYYLMDYNKKIVEIGNQNYLESAKKIYPYINIFNEPKIINKELIPEKRGNIFVSNHLGSLDQFPLTYAIGHRPIHFLAKDTLLSMTLREYLNLDKHKIIKLLEKMSFNKVQELLNQTVGDYYKSRGAIFINENSEVSKGRAMIEMIKMILHGEDIFIFPEGTRNNTGEFLLPFAEGAAKLAQITGAGITTIGIEDCKNMLKRHPKIRFGKTITVGPTDDLTEVTERVRNTVAELIWANMEDELNSHKITSYSLIKKYNSLNGIHK